ncbi:hypothetical protein [Clostridium thermarum]|uniref:hypothetical protein n=1 Tax=Clostridium thermarum TaxID=1716543 RepID=UPI00111DD22A|nr:hypothetical protein [Clostridium thermarum]
MLGITLIVTCMVTTSVLAEQNDPTLQTEIISLSSISGEGTGVATQTPSLLTEPGGGIRPMGTKPPSSSAQTIVLGRYNGSITWATGYLYTDKWVRTSKSYITAEADFGMYDNQTDAINRTNPLSNAHANIFIYLVDSSGNRTATQSIQTNRGTQGISFSVTPNKDYYVVFNFATGYYQSGDFSVF